MNEHKTLGDLSPGAAFQLPSGRVGIKTEWSDGKVCQCMFAGEGGGTVAYLASSEVRPVDLPSALMMLADLMQESEAYRRGKDDGISEEREACAALADAEWQRCWAAGLEGMDFAENIHDAIRARGGPRQARQDSSASVVE